MNRLETAEEQVAAVDAFFSELEARDRQLKYVEEQAA